MPSKEELRAEISKLLRDGLVLMQKLQEKETPKDFVFAFEYQDWYSKALPTMRTLAPDRCDEFRQYYEPDPKRKNLQEGNWIIQDYMKGLVPWNAKSIVFDSKQRASHCLFNQIALLRSVESRLDSVLSHLESALFSDLKDAELATASALLKISPRAAGALAGVVLEGHLQRVANIHQVRIAKRNPTVSDLNEPLKQAGIYDMATWRKVSYLADLRNLCSHKKGDDPRPEQVIELIEGVAWALRMIA